MPPHTSEPSSTPATRVLSRAIPRGRPWHNSVDDRLTRKLMMLRLRRLHPVLAGTKCTATDSSGSTVVVPSLVQRLEWMLYNAAHSMHEYTHDQSLERRVQALVTQLEPKAIAEQRQQEGGSKRGRDRVIDDEIDHDPNRKRQCPSQQMLTVLSTSTSVFLLENDKNLVTLVLSFLSGRTVLRLRSVNKFMSENAPKMVSRLHLETHSPAMQRLSSGALMKLLLSCNKLSSLVVTSKLRDYAESDGSDKRTTRMMMHRRPSFNRPSHRDIRSKNGLLAGELVLKDITRAFERGACPELQELDLGSPLDYFAESDDVLKCLEAFATARRHSARSQRKVLLPGRLQYLRLDSTYLGDARLNRLADVFEQAADNNCSNCFGSLKTLVLRNNFIGEAGCQALLRILQCVPSLRVLDVSGNILTDLDALALGDWISCRANDFKSPHRNLRMPNGCRASYEAKPNWRRSDTSDTPTPAVQLRTLLLQDNFIGQGGLEALSLALNARLIPS